MSARVEKLWPGRTIVCLASGPSLTQADVDYVRGKARVIAINRVYDWAPWADVLFCADTKMWGWLNGAPGFEGLKYTLSKGTPATQLQVHRNGPLSADPAKLAGPNSGYQAINLAVHLGASRVLLLGYDQQPSGDRHHAHPEHPDRSHPDYHKSRRLFPLMIPALHAAGVEVVNCTPNSALSCFPRMSIREALVATAVAA